ncbi:hypothetical protein M011DRAFT_456148 [Sporormia fimetaria CBS 119925]|uniref:Uncharacterized protein n=1 Tax=Sporormia fimetaria CBS 119925 TaxID=1340428 RepID=A0A6A6VM52_9PLEO|nr:hypothetical protein M011DRAFT_456148 [Sporormia fimetaria CBS 119925]
MEMERNCSPVLPRKSFIRRARYPAENDPPWEGLEFIWPVGSDELGDELRHAYPQGKDLRQRKHMATIDHLKMELEAMQISATARLNSIATSTTGRSTSQEATYNSQEIVGLTSRRQSISHRTSPSPSSLGSPSLREPFRQEFAHTSTGEAPVTAGPVATPQTLVFNVADLKPMQPKTKKKMSKQELHEYKMRRIRGACDRCRRTKAKVFECTHDPDIGEASEITARPKRTGSPALDDAYPGPLKLRKSMHDAAEQHPAPDRDPVHGSTHFAEPDGTAEHAPLAATASGGWNHIGNQSDGYVDNVFFQEGYTSGTRSPGWGQYHLENAGHIQTGHHVDIPPNAEGSHLFGATLSAAPDSHLLNPDLTLNAIWMDQEDQGTTDDPTR